MISATSVIHTPWIGIAALVAMFLIPFIPAWFFEGPRTVKHRPRRHVCADCGADWYDGHTCGQPAVAQTASPLPIAGEAAPLHGELRRLDLSPMGELTEGERDLLLRAGEQ